MKTLVIFNDRDEADKRKLRLMQNAEGMYSVIWELRQQLRYLLKHAELKDNQSEVLEELKEFFLELINEELDNDILS